MIWGIEFETRKTVYVNERNVAGVQVIKDGGPTRLLLNGGGHIDVCGSADIWACKIQLAIAQSRSSDEIVAAIQDAPHPRILYGGGGYDFD